MSQVDERAHAATLTTTDLLASLRRLGIVLPQAEPVVDYLTRHADIAPMVEAASRAAHRRFGDTAQVALELYRDPEEEDEYLTLYIRQAEYDPQIIEYIRALWPEYGPALDGKSGWLLVTTDFRQP